MNARVDIPTNATSAPSDAELLAFDAVLEAASTITVQAAALFAAASSCDMAETEARLWLIRRALLVATSSWRAAVPPLPNQGGADDRTH